MEDNWQPIETAPKKVRLRLWWRPRDDPRYPHPPAHASPLSNNKWAECEIHGTLSNETPSDGPPTHVWFEGRYIDIWHVTHWMHTAPAPYAEHSPHERQSDKESKDDG